MIRGEERGLILLMNLLIGLLPPIISNSGAFTVSDEMRADPGVACRQVKSVFLGARAHCLVWLVKSLSLSLNTTFYIRAPTLPGPRPPPDYLYEARREKAGTRLQSMYSAIGQNQPLLSSGLSAPAKRFPS